MWEPENVARGSGVCTAAGVPTGRLSPAGRIPPLGHARCFKLLQKMLSWKKPEP